MLKSAKQTLWGNSNFVFTIHLEEAVPITCCGTDLLIRYIELRSKVKDVFLLNHVDAICQIGDAIGNENNGVKVDIWLTSSFG